MDSLSTRGHPFVLRRTPFESLPVLHSLWREPLLVLLIAACGCLEPALSIAAWRSAGVE